MHAGVTAGGKNVLSKSLDVAGVAGRNAALKTNTTWTQRMGAYGRQAIGMQSRKEGLDKQIGYHKSIKKHVSNMEGVARNQLTKKSANWKWVQQERSNLQQAVKEQKALKLDVKDKNGNVTSSRMVNFGDSDYSKAYNQYLNDFFLQEKKMIQSYINSNGKVIDNVDTGEENYQIAIEKKAFVDEIKNNKLEYTDEKGVNLVNDLDSPTWDEIDSVGKVAEEKAARIENSQDYQDSVNSC